MLDLTPDQVNIPANLKDKPEVIEELTKILAEVKTLVLSGLKSTEDEITDEGEIQVLKSCILLETAMRFYCVNTPAQYSAPRYLFFFNIDAYNLFRRYYQIGLRY